MKNLIQKFRKKTSTFYQSKSYAILLVSFLVLAIISCLVSCFYMDWLIRIAFCLCSIFEIIHFYTVKKAKYFSFRIKKEYWIVVYEKKDKPLYYSGYSEESKYVCSPYVRDAALFCKESLARNVKDVLGDDFKLCKISKIPNE